MADDKKELGRPTSGDRPKKTGRRQPASRRRPSVGPTNVPVVYSDLRGRQQEIALLEALLVNGGARLVTITGTGGCGKTRLAVELVNRHGHGFEDGAAFVGLAAVTDPARVFDEISRTLRIALPCGTRSGAPASPSPSRAATCCSCSTTSSR